MNKNPTPSARRRRVLIVTLAGAALVAAALSAYFFIPAPAAPAATPVSAEDTAQPAPTLAAAATAVPAPTETPVPQAQLSTLERSLYDAKLALDPASMTLQGKLVTDYRCTSAEPVYYLVFNLYPNGVTPGCLSINSVAVDGVAAYYELSENGQQLTVPLNATLTEGYGAKVYIDYSVAIPETGDRFGYGRSGILLGGVLPTLALCENGVWRQDVYDDKGDPFVSEVSDYRVAVTLPAEYAVACTGTETESRTEADGSVTHYIDAPLVRDFSLAARKGAYTSTGYAAGGVTVFAVARSQAEADYCVFTACEALEFFSARIGAYPYKRLCIAQMDAAGGMEYPGMILVNYEACKESSRKYGDFILAHETAHQWWYAVVGSDQINAPWQDESLTEFMGLEFLRCCRERSVYEEMRDAEFEPLQEYSRPQALDSTLYELNEFNYVMLIYNYGARMYYDLFDELGEAAFYEGLQNYYNANMFALATGEELIAAFSEAAGRDMSEWFHERMREPTLAELYGDSEPGIGSIPQG